MQVAQWPGHGRPVVLVHGFMDSAHGWDGYCKATHRPCYALDLPGFGESSAPKQAELSTYARAVCAVIDHFELEEVILVGHSLGGAVATAVADLIPERVLSLVLLAPAGFGPLPLAELADRPVVRRLLPAAVPLAMVNPLISGALYALEVSGGHFAPLGLQARLVRQAFRGPRGAEAALQTLARMSEALRKGPARSNPAYTGPVSALWGTRDRLVPVAHADLFRAAFPKGHLEVWTGMAHHPQVEHPHRLARFIERSASRARDEHRRRRRAARRRPPSSLAA